MSDLLMYLRKTNDGKFTSILSILYSFLATYLLLSDDFITHYQKMDIVLGFYCMPILFIAVLINHRIGSSPTDNTPVIPCIISNIAMALLPLYFIWR